WRICPFRYTTVSIEGCCGPRSSVWTWNTRSPRLTSVLKPELICVLGFRPKKMSLNRKNLRSAIDRFAPGRYYSSATKMSGEYLDSYGPILLMFILAAGLAAVLILASTIVGKHKRTKEKDQPYECAIAPTGDARE